jgi:CRP-like cAMP-binding protein
VSGKDWLPAAVRAAAIDRKLKSGEALFRLGDKTAGLCEVLAGRVRMCRVDRSDHAVILYVAGPGETLAEASLFSPAYHCDAIASTDAVVRIYPKPALLAAFDKDPKAAQAFSATLANQVMHLRTRIEQRNIRSARERVRHFFEHQRRRRRTHHRSARHAQGSRRRTRAHPRSTLPHAGRA